MKKIFLILLGLILSLAMVEAILRISDTLVEKPYVEEISGSLYRYDDLLGWSMLPNVSVKQASRDFNVVYKTNAQGFRSDADFLRIKTKKRIAVLGDSFVFGVGVPLDQAFSKLIETETNDEVMDFGVSGYDPGQYLLLLQNQALKYDPDVVVYALYLGNDIEDVVLDHPYQGDRYKPYFDIEDGKLAVKNVPPPDEKARLENVDTRIKNRLFYDSLSWILKLKSFDLVKNLVKDQFYPILEKGGLVKNPNDYEKNFEVIRLILKETVKKLAGKKLVVLVVPSMNIKHNYLEKELGSKIGDILREEKIPFVDLTPQILNDSEKYYFPHEGHWNVFGHALAAKSGIVDLLND